MTDEGCVSVSVWGRRRARRSTSEAEEGTPASVHCPLVKFYSSFLTRCLADPARLNEALDISTNTVIPRFYSHLSIYVFLQVFFNSR